MIRRPFRIAVTSLGLVLALNAPAAVQAQTVTSQETVRSVRRLLGRLPYYGVFDYIVFGVDRGTVTLAGYVYQGRLKDDAASAVKHASGVDEVLNKIEILPASLLDDRIRWATFFSVARRTFFAYFIPFTRQISSP